MAFSKTLLSLVLAGPLPAAFGAQEPAAAGPSIPCTAAECTGVGQLCAWKVVQMHQTSFVPGPYQQFPMASIEENFMARLGELENSTVGGKPSPALQDPCPIDLAALAHMPSPPPCAGAMAQPGPAAATMAQPGPAAMGGAMGGATGGAGGASSFGLRKGQFVPGGFASFLPGSGGSAAASSTREAASEQVAMPQGAMDRRQYLATIEVGKCAKRMQQAWSGKAGSPAVRLPVLLATADMCGGKPELHEWHVCQFAEIEVHVPIKYQEFTAKAVERQFARRLEQLEGVRDLMLLDQPVEVALPVILMGADQCPTIGELDAWRVAKTAEIRNIVPTDYQPLALGALDRTFRERFSALAAQQSLSVAEPPSSRSGMAALLVLAGLLVPVLISMLTSAGSAAAGPRTPRTQCPEEGCGDYLLQEAC